MPAVLSMMLGEGRTELDASTQETVAAWACLKAMIWRYVEGIHPVPRDWLDYIFDVRKPPDGWHVFTTLYSGNVIQFAEVHDFSLRVATTDLTFPARAEDQGILLSLIVGYFAIKVIGIRTPIPLPFKTNILRIWPSSPLTLLWPPTTHIKDGRSLDTFRRMWFDSSSPPLSPLRG